MFKAPVKVKDDDTQKTKHDGLEESVRLIGIDTEEIIKAGYTSVLTYALNVKYEDRFLKAYQGTREGKKGLWH